MLRTKYICPGGGGFSLSSSLSLTHSLPPCLSACLSVRLSRALVRDEQGGSRQKKFGCAGCGYLVRAVKAAGIPKGETFPSLPYSHAKPRRCYFCTYIHTNISYFCCVASYSMYRCVCCTRSTTYYYNGADLCPLPHDDTHSTTA